MWKVMSECWILSILVILAVRTRRPVLSSLIGANHCMY